MSEHHATLNEWIAAIKPLHLPSMAAAEARQAHLTKPSGALGRLETLSIQLAGIMAEPRPRLTHKVIVVMAGDHGVSAEGVSAYPQSVTAQMVMNFLEGGAAINVLARQVDPGQTVAASFNTPTLFVIAEDLTKMKLEVAIDEADVGEVKVGQKANFTVDAFPGRTFPATITRVDLGSNLTVSAATSSASSTT